MTVLLCCSLSLLWAQREPCATDQVLQHQLRQDPTLELRMQALERKVQQWIQQQHIQRTATEVFTIPVVVHIVYLDSSENIDDSLVHQQIAILNEDFGFRNSDTTNIRPLFRGRAANVGIEFCLAKVDPQGNPTTGITRTQGVSPKIFGIPLGFFDPLTNNIKSVEGGGADPWPADQYLNIWVGNIGAELLGLLGYAQFPQSYTDPEIGDSGQQALETDGVVVDYRAFGGNADYLMVPGGRSATHEVAHWLGLRHIWGDGDCSKDDFVDDTPTTAGASQACDTTANTCSDTTSNVADEPDMVENYMDYALGCSNMFTLGQKARMLGYLLNDSIRSALLTSPACQESTTAIGPLPEAISWKVFPNPTSGLLQLRWQNQSPQPAHIQLMDLQGRSLLDLSSRQHELQIDLGPHPAGVYLIRLTTTAGTAVKKVVLH